MPLKVDVLLPNSSQYNVLHHFAKKLSEALQRHGYTTRLLNKSEYTVSLFDDPPDFTMGFNGAPTNEEKEFLCDHARVPHIACLVDPPYRFMHLLTSPYILVACDDNYWVEAFKNEGFPHLYFFPHAVEKELFIPTSAKPIYETVFLGTFVDNRQFSSEWRSRYPEPVWQAMEEAMEVTFSKQPVYFAQAFIQRLNEKIANEGIPHFDLTAVFQDLELYVKARDRLDLLHSIKTSRLDVFGGSTTFYGWKEHFAGQSNVIVHPAVAYEQALQIMQNSKIVLNSGLKTFYGAHERIFSGLAAGAAVATSANAYLQEHFTDAETILLYTHADLASLDEKIKFYVQNDQPREDLIQKGRNLVMQYHTWDARLADLISQVLPRINALNA